MKLIIKNETDYSTRDLRKLVLRAIKAEADFPKDWKWDRYVVRIAYSRRAGISGYGYYNSRNFCLKLPRPKMLVLRVNQQQYPYELSPESITRLAQVAIHEIGHNLGLRHAEMIDSSKIDVSWAAGLRVQLNMKPAQARIPGQDKRRQNAEKREAKARAHVDRLEREIKRKQKLLRKWKNKVRYYDRKKDKAAGEGD